MAKKHNRNQELLKVIGEEVVLARRDLRTTIQVRFASDDRVWTDENPVLRTGDWIKRADGRRYLVQITVHSNGVQYLEVGEIKENKNV